MHGKNENTPVIPCASVDSTMISEMAANVQWEEVYMKDGGAADGQQSQMQLPPFHIKESVLELMHIHVERGDECALDNVQHRL